MLPFICVTLADCDEGDVRLLDGTDDSNGRVEVCQDGMWTPVCSNQYDHNIATVVCRQLGYNSTEGTFTVPLCLQIPLKMPKCRGIF